jgi:glycosyltransferase involved in cell wall biosynthesis
MAGVPAMVAAISGLGTVFISRGKSDSLSLRPIKWLYRLALGHPNSKVIFQNTDDFLVLKNIRAVHSTQGVLIKGSGVSIDEYRLFPEPVGVPAVVFAGRLLADKGVREFVNAARILKDRGVLARFLLIGSPDPDNPSSISESELTRWRSAGVVEQLGYRNDIAVCFAHSNIVVLPSYREGLPKVLIEAAACGRAVVTTDVPGCRDAIIPNKTGLLVPPRNAKKLADVIQWLIEHPKERAAMGIAGRQLAEREFALGKIVREHLEVYGELLENIS